MGSNNLDYLRGLCSKATGGPWNESTVLTEDDKVLALESRCVIPALIAFIETRDGEILRLKRELAEEKEALSKLEIELKEKSTKLTKITEALHG